MVASHQQRKSPYLGLVPYDEDDAAFFFGREKETRLIIANLFASPLTVVYGPSGVGKSSVLRAGVLHNLRMRDDVLVVAFNSWQARPLSELKAAVRQAAVAIKGSGVEFRLDDSLAKYVSKCVAQTGRHLMVILDQFEEQFLYRNQDNQFSSEFPEAVMQREHTVSFIIAIREDAVAQLDRFEGRISSLFDNCLRIEHLGLEAARAAIVKPVEQYNRLQAPDGQHVRVESTLVERVLEEVKTGKVIVGEAGRSVIAPTTTPTEVRIETPYLQLVMTRLWDEEMHSGSHVLRLETLYHLGGAEHIIRTHLDGVMEKLNESERHIAAAVFHQLVTPSGTKIAHTVADLAGYANIDQGPLSSMLNKLSSAEIRILRPVEPSPYQPDAPRYEIFHDVLAPAILDWRKRYVQAQLVQQKASETVEYIVVGSGAGGGPLAANLAEAGHKVLLLEAGGDPVQLADARLPDDYNVPAFHPFASENKAIKWDFFVWHYADEELQKRDPKFIPERGGVLYPRAGTLGGCTAHNALILIYPHNDDWDYIAHLTGDPSWEAENMREYFERMEDCRYRTAHRWLSNRLIPNLTRHGFDGWLSTEMPRPLATIEDREDRDLMKLIVLSASAATRKMGDVLERITRFVKFGFDPNDWRWVQSKSYGIQVTPLTTRNHARIGSRERILDVARKYPHNLQIELNALVTRVLFDNKNRAVGVEYLKGERLYRAHENPSQRAAEVRQAFATHETILCGGAFNTPQLLMLSGIGPRQELQRHNIDVRVDLPGVGKNLQDHYEISVVNRMKKDWKVLSGATFGKDDPQYRKWEARREGVYTTNGGVIAVIIRSTPAQSRPDLFCLGLLDRFEGYFPGYSELIAQHHNYFSWLVLKAHPINTTGTVTLRSADPRDTPLINFHYFDEGNDTAQTDLEAVVDGIGFVRAVTAGMSEYIAEEELPGKDVQSRTQLQQFVKDRAWGHHACGTCKIGSQDDPMAVVDSKFRVHGTRSLRVVDASVFPRIPGFFIMSSVYMIAEKASDVILADRTLIEKNEDEQNSNYL